MVLEDLKFLSEVSVPFCKVCRFSDPRRAGQISDRATLWNPFFWSGRGDVRNFAPGPWGFTKALKVPQVCLTAFRLCVDDPKKG